MHITVGHVPLEERRIVAPQEWLAAINDAATQIHPGAIFVNNMKPDWHTNRPYEVPAWTHYLFYCEQSSMHYRSETDEGCAMAGDLLWFPPGSRYRVWLQGEQLVPLIRMRFQVIGEGGQLSPWAGSRHFRRALSFPQRTQELVSELQRPDDFLDARVRAWLTLLTTDLLRVENMAEGALNNAQLHRLSEYVRKHASAWPKPAELAELVELSAAYFTRIFQKTLGMSPKRWIMEERISLACELLLDTDLSITEIAHQLGYESHHLLSRQFLQVQHISPRDYRRLH